VNPTGSSALSTAGRNATITSLMVCCGFIICWSPNQMIFLLNSLGHPINFEGWFYHFASSVIPSHFESSEATSPPIRTLYWPTLSRPALSCSSAISYMYFLLHWFIILLPGYRWFYHFTVVLLFTNSCVNPFIYAGKYREFQEGVRRLISKLIPNREQSQIAAIA